MKTDTAQYSETERKIFQAAIGVFAREGLKGARMQEIADAAGMNKALVHYYFRGKERLYASVFEYIIRHHFTAMFRLVARSKPSPASLRVFIDKYIDLLRDNPHLVSFMAHELSRGMETMRGTMERIFAETGEGPQILVRWVRGMEKARLIRPVDPIQLVATLIGACIIPFLNFPILTVMDPTLAARRDHFLEERKDHIYRLIYDGIKRR